MEIIFNQELKTKEDITPSSKLTFKKTQESLIVGIIRENQERSGGVSLFYHMPHPEAIELVKALNAIYGNFTASFH